MPDRNEFSVEKTLAATLDIANDVLGRHVTAEDNFFSLGGDSLSAIRLLMRLEDFVGRDVDEDALFNSLTFADVALAVSRLV